MKDGFIKVGAGKIKTRVADTKWNTAEIIKLINKADSLGVKLLVLPELCLTGASCGSLFYNDTLQAGALEGLSLILKQTENTDITTVLGMPVKAQGNIFDCAVVIKGSNILGVVPSTQKSNIFASDISRLDNFTLFDKNVPFNADMVFCCASLPDFSFAVAVGESITAHPTLSTAQPCASAETVGKSDMRRTLIKAESYKNSGGIIYASCGEGESTTDQVYSGHLIIGEMGKILKENTPLDDTDLIVSELDVSKLSNERAKGNCPPFDFYTVYFDTTVCNTTLTRHIKRNPFIPEDKKELEERIKTILSIQASGLKKRIEHTFSKSVVIGISGGLDSTLALLVCAKAMDELDRKRSDIIAVTMPCFGTTKRTKSNAEVLCNCLGVTFMEINITSAVKQHFEDIGHDINVHDLTFENSQARERTQVLMDLAGKRGGFVVGTGDLSELALGWATYNGDHMSMYGVNGGVPKTLIKNIVSFVAEKSEGELSRVLSDIVDTPVSPELLPAEENGEISQKTEDLVGPYELHDFFLYYFCRFGFSPSKIYRLALYALGDIYDSETIKKWLKNFVKRFITQQFKRSCLPDGVKVGSVSLSPRGDFPMPSDAAYTLFLTEAENL